MRSTGESPNAENVSTLSQILQAGGPGKKYFEPEAGSGILPRASPPGQETPGTFWEGLERQAASA